MGQEDAVLEQWCYKAGRVGGKWSRAFDGEAQEQSGLSKQSVHALAEEAGKVGDIPKLRCPGHVSLHGWSSNFASKPSTDSLSTCHQPRWLMQPQGVNVTNE